MGAAPLSHIGRPITSVETGNVAFAGHLAWSIPEGERSTRAARIKGCSNFFCDAQIATVITHFYRKGTLYFSKHLSKGLPSL